MEGDLNAGNPRPIEKIVHGSLVRLLVARTVGAEKHDAVAGPAGVIGEAPMTASVECDDRLDPTATIEVEATGRRTAGEPQ